MAHNLSTEYDAIKAALDAGGFASDKETAALVPLLKKVVGNDGFDPTQSDALEKLRTRLLLGTGTPSSDKSVSEGKRTLDMASAYAGNTFSGNAQAIQRAAALKGLRHTHLLAKAGARSVWVVNIPRAYRDWPSLELAGLSATEKTLVSRINRTRAYFSDRHMRHMHTGARDALRWVQKTLIVLGNYGKDKGKSANLVKRWFETGSTSASDLDAIVVKLVDGFKKIQAALNSNQLIFSDYPPDRGTADEKNTEAFVFNGAWADRLKVVYIEKGFFARGANVLSGRDNWARIIVHELSHSLLGTEDYPPDNSYGWQGINPKDGKFNGNGAIRNAENWAYFAGDCAHALSKSEAATALKLP
jgi:hypothetical protein